MWKKSMWKNKGLFRYGIVATDRNAGYLLWFKVPTSSISIMLIHILHTLVHNQTFYPTFKVTSAVIYCNKS